MAGEDNVADDQRVKLRSYQQEMLEQSLARNVIVAMPTGSGKTHIAVARIQAELERSEAEKVGSTVRQLPRGSICTDLSRVACVVYGAQQVPE